MQKYKLWIVIALIVLCLITLILWLAPRDEAQARVSGPQSTNESSAQQAAALANGPVNNIFPSPSQQDTEINCQMQMDASNRLIVNEQTRNCFEYFITQYGEKTSNKSSEILKPIFSKIIRILHSHKFWIFGIVISSIVKVWEN